MRLNRSGTALILCLAARSISLTAQAGPTLEPVRRFEVASVRQVTSSERAPMQWQPSGRFTSGVPILSLLSIGYGLPLYRIEGLPDWARTTLFAINASAGRQVEIEERPAYYRGLLVDRFRFSGHVERREMDVYSLTLSRSDGQLGPGLRRSSVNCDETIAENRRRSLAGERPAPPPAGQRPTCGSVGGASSLTGGATELAGLVAMLAQALGRPVVDRTGLTGRFDIDFKAAPPGAREGSPLGSLPPISTALEDQLGLKLTRDSAPVDVLVVDRLEMPTEN
jgi:uncharacterized protein (TIGR03435 family)